LVQYIDRKKPDTFKEDSIRIEDAIAEDAIAAIVREAKNRQVVILNEAHHVPLHRAFAMKLARELRKIGYEYLACEAFQEALDKAYIFLQ